MTENVNNEEIGDSAQGADHISADGVTSPAVTATEVSTIRMAVSGAIRNRPLSSVIVTSLLALVLGMGMGALGGHEGHRPFGGPHNGFSMHDRDSRGPWGHNPMMGPDRQGNDDHWGPGPMMGGPKGDGGQEFGPAPSELPLPSQSNLPGPNVTPHN